MMFKIRLKVELFAVMKYSVIHITIFSVGCNVCDIRIVNRELM